MDNENHFMFIALLALAVLAFYIGEANNAALNMRESQQAKGRLQQNQP